MSERRGVVSKTWKWKQVSTGFTVSERELPRTYQVWFWQVWGRAADRSGWLGWVRPKVTMPTLEDLILSHAAKMQQSLVDGNALLSRLRRP